MNVTEAIERLKERGYKQTSSRENMLHFFAGSEKYLTARDVQIQYPKLSFDTIYRNLATFVEIGVLEQTELNKEKHFRFNCGLAHHHHHFICTKCGMTKGIDSCPMDTAKTSLNGYEIADHKFEIYGFCPSCKKDK